MKTNRHIPGSTPSTLYDLKVIDEDWDFDNDPADARDILRIAQAVGQSNDSLFRNLSEEPQ